MIKLANEDYYKAITPLSHVKINTLFAEAVIRQSIPGSIYVDCDIEPSTFYVAHPYGMSLLFGNSDNESFNRDLYDYLSNTNRIRQNQEWLQADPARDWNDMIDSMIYARNSNKIMKNTRVNFSFNREAYEKTKSQFHRHDHEVVQITKELFLAQPGRVTPRYFWQDADRFLAEGIGYSLLCSGEVASTAFSAFRNKHQLEIGIETSDTYRGKGFAYSVCSALIDYCLDNQLEPVWACRLENEGSYNLALKLGFTPALTIPYYRLAV